uniref:Uncharacterized protein n=1 Tax=Sphaerodactylus townsendi TaxID=933632 RepID=A0ACB8G547_9SAUR
MAVSVSQTKKSLSNLLDKKALGSSMATLPNSNFGPGFLQTHSTSNLQALGNANAKFSSGSSTSHCSFGNLMEPGSRRGRGSSSPTALLNKGNKFQDCSFTKNGKCSQQHQQQVVVMAAVTTLSKGGGGGESDGGHPIKLQDVALPAFRGEQCKYGKKCQCAHGHQELHSLTHHAQYKMEIYDLCHTM